MKAYYCSRLTWTDWSSIWWIIIVEADKNSYKKNNPLDNNHIVYVSPNNFDPNTLIDFQWITCFNSYLKTLKPNNSTTNKLLVLASYLYEDSNIHIDPVKYLIFLYYQKSLSVEEIHNIVKDKWMDYIYRQSIHKLFKKNFFWKLRKTSWSYRTSTKKKENKQSVKPREALLEKYEKKYNILKNYIKNKVNNLIYNNFDINIYKKFELKIDKILYILWITLWINEHDILYINKTLKIWAIIIQNTLNEQIENFIHKYNLNIRILHKDIYNIIKKAS